MNTNLLRNDLQSEKYTRACKDEEEVGRGEVSGTSSCIMDSPHDSKSLEREYIDNRGFPYDANSKTFDGSLTMIERNAQCMFLVPGPNNTSMSGFSTPEDIQTQTSHKYISPRVNSLEITNDKTKCPSDINPLMYETIDLNIISDISTSEITVNKSFRIHPYPNWENLSQNALQPNSDIREKLCEADLDQMATDTREAAIDRRRSTEKHVDSGEKPSVNIREKTFAGKENLSQHKSIHGDKKRPTCDVCNKEFSWMSSLTVHKRSHTGEKPFVCSFCKKGFSRLSYLRRHDRTHTGEKPFVCSVCQKGFSRLYLLTDHERTHTGEKPFACDVCEKSFFSKISLGRHELTHIGRKTFTCSVCEKSFSRKGHLTQQRVTHSEEKPFICDICKIHFTQQSKLKKQEGRLLTGEDSLVAYVFEKTAPEKENIAEQKLILSDEKPFICDLCYKTYADRSSLTEHAIMLTGDKLIVCDDCQNSFTE